MTIQLNGEARTVNPDSTVLDLLQMLELNPKFVAVEVNLELVPQLAWRAKAPGERSSRSRHAGRRRLKNSA